MKKIFFYILFSFILYAQDQDINQITGGGDISSQGVNNKNELDELKKEIRELKRQVEELKGKKSTENKKDTESPLDKILAGSKEKDQETQTQYSNFERDFFMQLHSPDFKKSLMERYQWQLLFWTHGNYSNNSDLRKLDNTNTTSVDLTDDRTYFIVGGIQFDNFFPVHPRVDLRFDIWRFGFWGGDQLGGRDANNDIKTTPIGANTVNFGQLYIDFHFKLNPTYHDKFSLRVGRQDFRLGGKIFRDFFQEDILDAIVLKYYDRKYGKLDLLLFDLFSNSADTRDVNFVRFISTDNTTVRNFNGNSATYRQGFIYKYYFIGDSNYIGTHADLRIFYFYSRFGGTNQPFGGADRTNNGTTGNFIDRDFSVMRGFRFNFGYSEYFRSSFTYAESFGIDRKTPTLDFQSRDVDNNGKGYGLETELAFFKRRFRMTPTLFYAQGGKYYADGTQYSHGFVSMKADQVGGLLVDLYWGVHPSAYTSGQGVADLPYNRDRKTGTLSKHLGIAIGILENLFLKLDVWRIHDTNQIALVTGSIPNPIQFYLNKDNGSTVYQDILISLYKDIYPNNQTNILAARRFGTPLGEEYNMGLDWSIYRGLKVWATVGIFKPMRYYSTAGLIQGTPQGNTPFTGFQMGTVLIF